MRKIIFATGSNEKFAEAQQIIPSLERLSIDLPEIQEIDQRKIIEAKLKAAQDQGIKDILVEDTGLYFRSLNNSLPGPLVKWFVKSVGNEGLISLANLNSSAPEACAVTTIGFLAADYDTPVFFEGRLNGKIGPIKGSGFGWDAIFYPEGSELSFGQMTLEQKSAVSHRGKAFRLFAEHLSL